MPATRHRSMAQSDLSDLSDPSDEEVTEAPLAPVLTMPFSPTPDGDIAAAPDSVIALRLTADATIDPETIWASMPSDAADAVDVTWRVVHDSAADIWVLFAPRGQWADDARILLEAGAVTADGTSLESEPYTFHIDPAHAAASPADEVTATVIDTDEGPAWHITPEQAYDAPQSVRMPDASADRTITIRHGGILQW